MQLNPSEISDLIKQRIKNYDLGAESRSEGSVVSVTDGIVRIYGLADAVQGEMLEFPGDSYGMALNLERDSVGCVVLGSYEHITEGDTVKCTGRILEVPVGDELLGRVVNSLGIAIDGKGPLNTKKTLPLERIAPGVVIDVCDLPLLPRSPLVALVESTGVALLDSGEQIIGRPDLELAGVDLIADARIGTTCQVAVVARRRAAYRDAEVPSGRVGYRITDDV